MSCPLRRFDDAKLQASNRPTNTVAAKELADRLATMNQERQRQDTMWIQDEPTTSQQKQQQSFFPVSTRDVGTTTNQKETQRR
jgi:ABC-type cobalamin/Fe3+-siderophores transport system ATPase subunit